MRIQLAWPVPAFVLASWLGCTSFYEPAPSSSTSALSPTDATRIARRTYPDLAALYEGEQGLYRGCGPNNGVCHNSKEFPNLATLGSVVQNIGVPCNEKRDDPSQVHDLCERTGDVLRIGERTSEIAAVTSATNDGTTRAWTIHTRTPLTFGAGERVLIARALPEQRELSLLALSDMGATIVADASDASQRTFLVTLPALSANPEEQEDDVLGPAFSHAGEPANPLAVQVGDPNRNGTFGASLGGRLIVPGDPARSYLFTRLTDPNAGPLMPRANCCYWTKASLRALYCWVAGLAPDGHNALDPIDYDRCPPGPVDSVDYPEPGPSCETSGMCPVRPRGVLSDAPTFSNVYDGIIRASCNGSTCHVGGAAGGLDMSTKARAYTSIVDARRVVPGDPQHSPFYVRLAPELCTGDCKTMPKGQAPLAPNVRAIVERWILEGAKDD